MKRVHFTFGMLLFFLMTVSAAAQNTSPTITAAPSIHVTVGNAATSTTIATVADAEDGAGSLTVTAITVPSGIEVTSITNTSGTVTAAIAATCDAAAGENDIVLQVADSGDATATATFAVIVASLPPPDKPAITATENGTGTTDQACPAQPLTLTASASGATSYQWFSNNDTISGATSATYDATGTATYYVAAMNACGSTMSDGYVVYNPTPHRAFLAAAGPTTFCSGGSVTIWSDSATGIQWYKDGVAIPGAGSQSYVATQSGSYTAVLNALGCLTAQSDPIVVTVNSIPSTPVITATENGTGTTDQACPAQPLTLTATSAGATSFQWYSDNAPISGATSATLVVTGAGNYYVVASNGSCTSAMSAAYLVQNPTPHKAFLSALGPTTFCSGGSVTIWSDSATGIQWYKDGVAIPGAGSQSYRATQSGSYTAVLNALGCMTSESDPIVVTVNSTPSTPVITPASASFCTGGNATLTSSSASGNQWYLNGTPIAGATSQNYVATVAGNYTVVVTSDSGCSSAPSSAAAVAVSSLPSATITAPYAVVTGSTGNSASVADAGAGATYAWTISGGTITSGAGTSSIRFTAGATGTMTINLTVTTSGGCVASSSASVISAVPVVVSGIHAPDGTTGGGKSVTIDGSGFAAGATVTFGGVAATDVVVVSSIKITATTPAHAAGSVDVTVTDPNTISGTLTGGYTYRGH